MSTMSFNGLLIISAIAVRRAAGPEPPGRDRQPGSPPGPPPLPRPGTSARATARARRPAGSHPARVARPAGSRCPRRARGPNPGRPSRGDAGWHDRGRRPAHARLPGTGHRFYAAFLSSPPISLAWATTWLVNGGQDHHRLRQPACRSGLGQSALGVPDPLPRRSGDRRDQARSAVTVASRPGGPAASRQGQLALLPGARMACAARGGIPPGRR